MKLPIPTNLDVKTFSSGKVTVTRAGTKNVIYEKTPDGKVLASQRPSVLLYEDASVSVADEKGRGIYFWEKVGLPYFVNDDTVYKTNYAGPLAATISSGRQQVDFFEIGDYLVILDYQNNEGWYIDSAADTTLVEITDVDFPPKQTPALQIVAGGAVLNETLFVGCTNGELWNSAIEDPTTWAGTDFITAEVDKDKGMSVRLHNQHVVFFGSRTIEFFYWANNPTGSPLSVRQDITLDMGGTSSDTYWADEGNLYFLGVTATGGVGVYVLSGFEVTKISNHDIDRIFYEAYTDSLPIIYASGFSSGGRSFYIITTNAATSATNAYEPVESFVYDTTGGWSIWTICLSGFCDYPLIDHTKGSNSFSKRGILSNGDLIGSLDSNYGVDIGVDTDWVEDGWVEPTWVSGAGTLLGEYINIEIILEPFDAGTMDYKYASNLRPVRTPQDDVYVTIPPSVIYPAADTRLNISWSDDEIENYKPVNTIELYESDSRIARCGRFKTRQHKITYSGPIYIEIEGLEFDLEKGM
ncbi:MAG: packaged DNA stabilization protein gp10 [Gammaproteobacteria bacterium]|nr:packaged DNA stabilization protein gp10 [Gammaproteobacteria bacterium]